MAECPSGKYLKEIVTTGGLTPQSPLKSGMIDWSGSEFDFAEWDSLAVSLMARTESAWRRLKSAPAIDSMPKDEYDTLVEGVNDIRSRYARMRKPWTTDASAVGTIGWSWGITLPDMAFDATDEIGAMVALVVDMQCLRQRVDEKIAMYGGSPDLPSGTHADPASATTLMEKLGYVTVAGIVMYGAYTVLKARQGKGAG